MNPEYQQSNVERERLLSEALLMIGGGGVETSMLPTRAHLRVLNDYYRGQLYAAGKRGTIMDGGLFP